MFRLAPRSAPEPAAPAPADGAAGPERIRLSDPPCAIRLRRSARATRFTLSVSRIGGEAVLTLPARASRAEAEDFARRHAAWLAGALARAPSPIAVRAGAPLPVAGEMLELAMTGRPRTRARREEGRLWLPGAPEEAGPRAKAYLKARARDALVPAATAYAARLDKAPAKVTLRDTRSRWGSCASTGALSFSWRLAMAPPDVLDYVAAHEAAHLVEMNHSAAFWAVVERLKPGWQAQRDWLKANGAELHCWRFGGEGGA